MEPSASAQNDKPPARVDRRFGRLVKLAGYVSPPPPVPVPAPVSMPSESVPSLSVQFQPYRPSRDYTDLRFRFDRRFYDEVLDTAFGQR
jgi:hypothetical protein